MTNINITNYQGHPCLAIKVTPNAPKSQIVAIATDGIKVKVSAPPDKGRANEELSRFLADALGLRKNELTIVQGETSRHKLIAFACSTDELRAKLAQLPVKS